VGADGIWSEVRAQLHGQPAGKESAKYSGYTCFTGVCTARPHDVTEVAYKVGSVLRHRIRFYLLARSFSSSPLARQVYLAKDKYFVCSDVGRGRMQWYAMLAQEPGIKKSGPQVPHLLDQYNGWSHEVLELLEATPEEDVTQRDL
jgi:zeaxanthin epoxidase